MELHVNAPVLVLAAGETVALDDVAGASIRAGCGTVWITEEGDPRDVVLGPGERFVVSRAGRTVVQAIDCARISIRGTDFPHLPQAA